MKKCCTFLLPSLYYFLHSTRRKLPLLESHKKSVLNCEEGRRRKSSQQETHKPTKKKEKKEDEKRRTRRRKEVGRAGETK